MITEDYVSFETAKLLKEKGFDFDYDCTTKQYYPENPIDECDPNGVYASTLQMAMKWLRENYNLHISLYKTSLGWAFEVFDISVCDITGSKMIYGQGILSKEDYTSTYEEACNKAIDYCIKNII